MGLWISGDGGRWAAGGKLVGRQLNNAVAVGGDALIDDENLFTPVS
jgi:hypothetical protein